MNLISGDIISYVKTGYGDILVHGCNCFNTFGSGLALQVKKEFPEAWTIDQSTHKGSRNKLGTFTYAMTTPIVVNAYTQYDYGRDGKDRFEYESFSLILNKLKYMWSSKHFVFPYIGSGLAGGNEVRITEQIRQFSHDIEFYGGQVTLVRYNK